MVLFSTSYTEYVKLVFFMALVDLQLGGTLVMLYVY